MEMLGAAIALRFAFPHDLYAQGEVVSHGRTVSLQSISSNLKVRFKHSPMSNRIIILFMDLLFRKL